jgi:galactose-1-phosphate uridylyltransferase
MFLWTQQIEKAFPELSKQKPKNAYKFWYPFSPEGNAQRRIALEKAIELTY